MKVLHVVKTADGARWASSMAEMQVNQGLEVHVALPEMAGEANSHWENSGAVIHRIDLSLPTRKPHKLFARIRACRQMVDELQPDLIHLHFFTNAVLVRLALRGRSSVPRLFQIPGPLHLEHTLFRKLEVWSAGKHDLWICSCRYMRNIYRREGIKDEKLFLSYISFAPMPLDESFDFRREYGFNPDTRLVGNISYMYKPRKYLREKKGLKRHEDLIEAFHRYHEKDPDAVGVLVGGQWGGGDDYETSLRAMAGKENAHIRFTGRIPAQRAMQVWSALDCAVHVPASENCGGVIDPLMQGTPAIGGDVGGIPEVIIDGVTGWLVPVGDPAALAEKIEYVLKNSDEAKKTAAKGKLLVHEMFNAKRTVDEVYEIYRFVLNQRDSRPEEFSSVKFVESLE